MRTDSFDILEAMWLRRERIRRSSKEIEGVPPLTYTAKNAGTLKNYRIYGQTVNSESVGDLVSDGDHAGEYRVPVTINDVTTNLYLTEPLKRVGNEAEYIDYGEQKWHRVRVNLFDGFSIHDKVPSVSNGDLVDSPSGGATTDFIAIDNGDITLSKTSAAESNMYIFLYAQDKSYIGYTQTTVSSILVLTGNNVNGYQNAKYARIRVDIESAYTQVDVMLNKGSTALPYEPYIENTDLDVTLPALPTIAGTNTLLVGTQVQPSKVMVKGKLKE